jgi:hypothetical protein
MDAKVKYYEKKLAHMMSNDDLLVYLPDVKENLITYKELKKFKTMEQLLEKPNFDYKILLIETQRNQGHWVCLAKKDDTVYWFDSYGQDPHENINMVSSCVRRMLGQENDEIKRLYKSAREEGFRVEENDFQFQADKPNINTCGRWILFFIQCIREGMGFEEMEALVEKQEAKTGKPSDILVVDWFP